VFLRFACVRCPDLLSPIPFVVVLSFHRYSGRLPPRSFIPLLPSWLVRYLFLSVRTLRASRSTLSGVRFFLTTFPLRRATPDDGSSSCRRRSVSTGIQNFPGSFSFALRLALQLDAGHCAASSVLKISLRLLP
jgi:hypothetical protein